MRLIDADAYTQEINNRIEAAIEWGANAIDEAIKTRAEQAIATFCEASLTAKKMPTIEAEPVRHGRWVKMSDADGDYYACSECGEELPRKWSFDGKFDIFPKKRTIDKTQYCSSCGAKMDKGET